MKKVRFSFLLKQIVFYCVVGFATAFVPPSITNYIDPPTGSSQTVYWHWGVYAIWALILAILPARNIYKETKNNLYFFLALILLPLIFPIMAALFFLAIVWGLRDLH